MALARSLVVLLGEALSTSAVAEQAKDIYNQPISTVLGCECKTPTCTTKHRFACKSAPFCTVKDSDCARGKAAWSWTFGYYDYCVYEPYEAYEILTASEKKDIVMSHVLKDATSGEFFNDLELLSGMMGESVRVSLNASADVFPDEKRRKLLHSVGVVGGIKFESTGDHAYGGLFQGAEYGLVRFSTLKKPSDSNFGPGMAVKFFRDGRPSANFMAVFSLDGQTCKHTDFFANDWSNHQDSPDDTGVKIIGAKFSQASYCTLMVGISDLASAEDGSVAESPFRLNFHPLVHAECSCTETFQQCLANVMKLEVGTKIFEVRAQAAPLDPHDTLIGHIILTDELVTSKFGDESLFFRHQPMEEDFNLKPEWLEAIDLKKQCGYSCTGTKVPPISAGCNVQCVTPLMLSVDGVDVMPDEMRSDDGPVLLFM